MSDVILIKMINGEEIVGKIKNEDEETVTVEKPAIVMLTPNQTGGVQVQMGPYSMFTEKPISLNKQAIMYMLKANMCAQLNSSKDVRSPLRKRYEKDLKYHWANMTSHI